MSTVQDPPFDNLIAVLHRFKIYSKAVSEHELENKAFEHLTKNGVSAERQAATSLGRYDILVRDGQSRYIIELKKFADRSCVDQLDRYARDCNGLILLCWQASNALRVVMALEKPRARIPLELVEVKQNCSFV